MALRVAVFSSGNGSNFQAIVDAVQAKKLDVSIELLVCDKPQAPVVARAERANIEAFVFKPKDYASREAYEQEILGILQQKQVDLVILAGYMRIITSVLVEPFEGRMINIHPSLLPSFPGVNAIGQALDHGVKLTGVTVHFVDGGLDSGPIIAQRSLEILADDTEDSLVQRIHRIEGELYPQVVGWIAAGKVSVEGRKVVVQAD